MKQINMTLLMCLNVAAFAQQVQFDYDRSANFNVYETYQWIDYQRVAVGDQLPGLRAAFIDGGGTFVQWTHPKQIVALLRD